MDDFLFPRKLKVLGYIFIVIGLILGIIRFNFGIKPDFLYGNIFAFISLYIEPIYFKIIRNQLLEEIAGVFILIGLILSAFSREKIEDADISNIRLKAFIISTYISSSYLVASLLFTFGVAFIYMMIINIYLYLIIYIITFKFFYLKFQNKRYENK